MRQIISQHISPAVHSPITDHHGSASSSTSQAAHITSVCDTLVLRSFSILILLLVGLSLDLIDVAGIIVDVDIIVIIDVGVGVDVVPLV